MENKRKITIHVPPELLEKAQRSTNEGVTATVRRGLQLLAASDAYKKLRQLRGRVKFSLKLDELREDRK